MMVKLRHFWIFEDSKPDRVTNMFEWENKITIKSLIGLLEHLNKIRNGYKETMPTF